MARPIKVASTSLCLVAVALVTAACGTQRISVPRSNASAHHGAVLFSQRCAGCHTLSYAGTHGSASNIRDREPINGPNFNVRCERPITRVLYAIENGGFSGAFMPQNIVVGQDARDVAQFVAQYAGHQAVTQPGQTPCVKLPVGTLPSPSQPVSNTSTGPTGTTATPTGSQGAAGATTTTSTSTTPSTAPSTGGASASGTAKHKKKKK